jgi:hypothetical protein
LFGHALVVAVGPVLDDEPVGHAQPVGLGGGEGPSGRREGDLDAGVLVVGDERAGLSTPEQARDIVWALLSPELYDALVVRRGWDPERDQSEVVQVGR